MFDVPAGYQGREDFVWTHDELVLAEEEGLGQLLYGAPTARLLGPV